MLTRVKTVHDMCVVFIYCVRLFWAGTLTSLLPFTSSLYCERLFMSTVDAATVVREEGHRDLFSSDYSLQTFFNTIVA